MNAVQLHYSPLCFQSRKILCFLKFHEIDFEGFEVEFGCPHSIPSSIYKETPVVGHGDHIVEDPRAIIRYLDRNFLSHKLASTAPQVQDRVFDTLDLIDRRILPKLISPLHFDRRVSQRLTEESLSRSRHSPLIRWYSAMRWSRRVERGLGIVGCPEPVSLFQEGLDLSAKLYSETEALQEEDTLRTIPISLASGILAVHELGELLPEYQELLQKQPALLTLIPRIMGS